jgi:hypothetical protein
MMTIKAIIDINRYSMGMGIECSSSIHAAVRILFHKDIHPQVTTPSIPTGFSLMCIKVNQM